MTNPNPRYVVDGHVFPNDDSDFAGDGQYPPFRILDTEAQHNLPGEYRTREEAQMIADRLDPEERGFVVAVVMKVTVSAHDEIEARGKAVRFIDEQCEDKQPWEDMVPAWSVLNVLPQREDDPLKSNGDERVWLAQDYQVNEFGGHLDA